jgi:hypothetical protein
LLEIDARHPIIPNPACSADILGIHGNPLRALPLFLVYLAVLVHTYSLATRHAAREAAGTAAGRALEPRRSSLQGVAPAEAVSNMQVTADLETGTAASGINEGSSSQPLRRTGSERYLGETFGSSVNSSLQRIGYGLLEASTAGKCSVYQLACAPGKLHSRCLIAVC